MKPSIRHFHTLDEPAELLYLQYSITIPLSTLLCDYLLFFYEYATPGRPNGREVYETSQEMISPIKRAIDRYILIPKINTNNNVLPSATTGYLLLALRAIRLSLVGTRHRQVRGFPPGPGRLLQGSMSCAKRCGLKYAGLMHVPRAPHLARNVDTSRRHDRLL